MKKVALLLPLTILMSFAHAQDILKLYLNSDLVTNYTSDDYNEIDGTVTSSRFNRISLAYQFGVSNKIFHEIEASYSSRMVPIVHIAYDNTAYQNDKDYFGIQYELNRIINKDQRLRFSVGGGILAYYMSYKRVPVQHGWYGDEQQYTGAMINIIPRLQYHISDRFMLDFNFKFAVFDWRIFKTETENPALPVSQANLETSETDFFPQTYGFRIGVGYKFR